MEPDGKLSKLIITFFFSGLISRRMPGTIGSLAATFVCLLLPRSPALLSVIAAFLFVIGTIFSQKYVEAHPDDKDPSFVVIDEAAAIFFCNALNSGSLATYWYNFLLFRVFDIWKPWPINKIEAYCKTRRSLFGLGIMLDDLAAALATSLCLSAF